MKASPTLRSASLLFFLVVCFTAPAVEDLDLTLFVQKCIPHPEGTNAHQTSEIVRRGLNTTIYRITPKHGELPYLVKEYNGDAKYRNELRGYQELGEMMKDGTGSFAVVKITDLGPERKAIRMENVEGRSLKSVLADPGVPPDIARKLSEDYERKLQALAVLLKARYQVEPKVERVDKNNGLILEVTREGKEPLTFAITTDQVIVSPDLTLTLVDPK